nr:PREDICTED: N-alpha-acetyltransferase 25, NatB auxiliary subunit isoform X4 [Latimeria chalumnae]|eukprot:XP_005996450.1 PREDICTED: N-alpha-acetyltransferase 25, NatB auxiliary subunit isoform X4 [Latimeria chalumnae]
MAARSHVQDPNDRRLRPIYDYLDNGNNKMAIQQADKLLKKHKDLHCAKVLKAIGLQRTGKQDEAFSLAQEVAALEPTDDNSLQALTILYREMHRPELVTKLYEAAVKKVPSSEEYHSHLFMAYARVGEYKKMQQAGMALYKIVPKNPYYFWSVMSLVMQSISARDEKLSQTMFLPLAERMVEKMVKEDKIEAEAEVQLYYMILERLAKYQEALYLVRGKLGEKLTSELQSRENKCMTMYKKLNKWLECNALSRKLLLKNPDDWQFYLSYFDSLFHLIDEEWIPPAEGHQSQEGKVDYSLEQAVKFVEERILNEESKGSRQLRGPYLAKLELIKRLRCRGMNDEHKLGEPEDLMFNYFQKFGDKPCCYTDLRVFVDLLSPDHHTKFVNRILETVPLSASAEDDLALPSDTKALQRHLCVMQLSRLLGLQHNMDWNLKLLLIRELKARYRHGLVFGKSCLKTELQLSDNYCLHAVHMVLDIWNETGEEWPLWQCLCLLEEGLTHSPSNAQFKLLLIRIYCLLGAFEPVVDLYSSLDAKHVQHDTIGSTSLEENIKSMNLNPEEDDIPWNELRDNRDLTILLNWDPKERQLSEEHKRLSMEEETGWLLIRSLTLRLVGSLSMLSHTVEPKNSEKTTENGVSSGIDTMRLLLRKLEAAMESGKQFIERNIEYPFLGPPPTPMAGAFSSGSCQCQVSCFNLVSNIYDMDVNGLEVTSEVQERIGNSFKSLLEQLKDLFRKCKGELIDLKDNQCKTSPVIIENLVFFVETICIVLWVSDYCGKILRPFKSNLQKKKKKKKETNTTMPPVFTSYQEYVMGLQTLLSEVLDHIKRLEVTLTTLKLEELSLEDTVLSEEEKKLSKIVQGRVLGSYQRSLQEIGELLKKRLDTVKNLKI